MYTMALRDYPELTLIQETLRVAFYNRTQSTFLPLSIMINNYWNRNEEALRSERRVSFFFLEKNGMGLVLQLLSTVFDHK